MKDFRLYFLSVFVGLFAGVAGGLFRWCLNASDGVRAVMFNHNIPWWYMVIVFILMWVLAIVVYKLTKVVPLIGGSGIPQSRGVIFGRYKFRRPWMQFISKFIGSIGIIGIGYSLGREGPSVEMGALGGTIVSKLGKASLTDQRYLQSAGAGAGLSAAFTAPIASTIFLIEDTMGWVSIRLVLPALIACIVASYCAHLIVPANIYLSVDITPPDCSFWFILLMLIGLSIVAALGGKLFNIALFNLKSFYAKIKMNVVFKLFIVTTFVFISGWFLLDLIAGGETELINQALSNGGSLWGLIGMILIKILLTAICYSTGLCGSLLLPLIVLGGLTGKAFALLLVQLSFIAPEATGYFTLIGMATFFVAVVRAPISGMMLILEMTGQYQIFLPLIITGTLTYLIGMYLNTVPVYHKLYQLMVGDEKNEYKKYLSTHFEVNKPSFLLDKKLSDLKLPGGSEVLGVYGKDSNNEGVELDTKLKEGDTIIVKTKEQNYENLFKVFRTMTNE